MSPLRFRLNIPAIWRSLGLTKLGSHIRVNGSTAIIQDDCILLIEFEGKRGTYFNLPGGGVDPGESVEEAAVRETLEEASAAVEIGRLLMVWEYEPERYACAHGMRHKVGFVFEGHLLPHAEPAMPEVPDKGQVAVRWLPLDVLPQVHLVPPIAKPLIESLKGGCTLFFTALP